MARRSKYLKHMTGRDKNFLKQLARTGVTDRSQAVNFSKMNLNRLRQLENSKYITRENRCVSGRSTEIIRLADKGKYFCKEKLEIKELAHAQTNHLEHDLNVTLAYNNLSEEERETWQHERQIIRELNSKIKDIDPKYKNSDGRLKTCIDARATINGQIVAIEVVGSSYTQADIELKEDIALNVAGCDDIFTIGR